MGIVNGPRKQRNHTQNSERKTPRIMYEVEKELKQEEEKGEEGGKEEKE